MANTLLTISKVTNECLRILENQLTFAKGVNRQYDSSFAKSGAKIGNTLNIRKPPRFQGRTGQVMSIEDQTDTSVPLVLNTQFGVDLQWTSQDWTLSLDDFAGRILAPAMATVANKIDLDGLGLFKQVGQSVGTLGTTPANLLPYLQAGAKLDYAAAPRDGMRSIVIEPLAQVNAVTSAIGYFNPQGEIADQYKSGNMGAYGGFKFSMDQNVPQFTSGAQGGTPVVNGAGQSGASIVTNGWTAAVANRLKAGDVITFAGVFAVNPQSRVSTGQLKQFVVTADVASDGSGNATIPVSPALVASGSFQNVSALPANSAAISVAATGGQSGFVNMAYHRDAFVLGCADLQLPDGVHKAARAKDDQLGLSVRMIQAYDITNDLMKCRFDILYGWAVMYPELACRIHG